jgi:Rrf2 family transcriptional regulator, cysteine metabolism repressor
MLFSTRAEYGVRLMVELGRQEDGAPVALSAVAEIEMLEVVQALEGAIAPMECFHATPEGKVSCSHEADGDRACATKLLWTRVQGGVTKALSGTTLAELVEFSDHHAPESSPKAAAHVAA